MKRNSIILICALLVLVAWWFITKTNTHSKTEVLKEKMNFTVDDINDVYKIFVVKRNEKPALLVRNGKIWYLDNEIKANPYVMQGILDVLANARIQYIPSEKEVEHTMPLMAAKGIKIETYNKKDEPLLSYYIGSVTQNEKGTHFYKEGGEQSYVMEMPYGEVNIRQRFNIRYDDWKSRLIFDDKVEEIASLKVEYPRSPTHGFIIQNRSGEFELKPRGLEQTPIQKQLKDDVFEKYLVTFKGVNFVEFNNEVFAKDSIMNNIPFMVTELINLKGDTFNLTLWPKSVQLATPRQAHNIDNPLNGYYAIDRNGDFGTVQQLVVRGTIAGYSDFFK